MSRLRILCAAAVLATAFAVHAAGEEAAHVPAQEERTGAVDAVYDGMLVINDSAIKLTDSILLYNEGGGRMSGNEFRVGDEVTLSLVEDEATGKWNIVSITRTKGASQQTSSSEAQPAGSQQKIRKVDGVWINY